MRARRAERTAVEARDRAVQAESKAATERDAARNARNDAVTARALAQQERDTAVTEKERADTEAGTAKALSDFLGKDLLGMANPWRKPNPRRSAAWPFHLIQTSQCGKPSM